MRFLQKAAGETKAEYCQSANFEIGKTRLSQREQSPPRPSAHFLQNYLFQDPLSDKEARTGLRRCSDCPRAARPSRPGYAANAVHGHAAMRRRHWTLRQLPGTAEQRHLQMASADSLAASCGFFASTVQAYLQLDLLLKWANLSDPEYR